MIDVLGLQLGTIFQGISALLLAVGIWWVRGMADRRRAVNEGAVISNNDAATIRAELRAEYDDLNKQNRIDIHDLKDKLQLTSAAQHLSEKALLEAASCQRQDRSDMASMMFVIRLLLNELKRLDPGSKVIEQAEMVLAHIEHGHHDDPSKSRALDNAEHTVADTKQAYLSATTACEEVKASEEEKEK